MSLLDMIERQLSLVKDNEDRRGLKDLRLIVNSKYFREYIDNVESVHNALKKIGLKKAEITTEDLDEVFT